MGNEAECTLMEGRSRSVGRALLETDYLLFRSDDKRVKIPFASLTKVSAAQGILSLTTADGTVTLDVGPSADRWADKIKHPRSLLDKLGVKPDLRVAVVNVDDPQFLTQLREHCSDIRAGTPARETDIVFFGAEDTRALSRLAALKKAIKPKGAIWVVHRKGKEATLKDVDVFAAAKAAGLVDIKVAAFSATHTAEKLVIPVKDR
jgi:hypothetical protein